MNEIEPKYCILITIKLKENLFLTISILGFTYKRLKGNQAMQASEASYSGCFLNDMEA